jgi:hypothetical protein
MMKGELCRELDCTNGCGSAGLPPNTQPRPLPTPKPSFMVVPIGSVLPTGWRGFTYAGAKGNRELYTCQTCRVEISVETNHSPVVVHRCPHAPANLHVPFREPGEGAGAPGVF